MRTLVVAGALSFLLGGIAHAQTPYLSGIYIFATNFCPVGYAPTDGALQQISQNTALFSLLGTTYGGDGKTTFALPNSKPIFTQNRATYTQCIATQGVFPSRN